MSGSAGPGRTWIVRVACLLAVPLALLVLPRPAEATPGQPCAVTGYLAGSPDEAGDLRGMLATAPAHQLDGVPLDRVDHWTIPAGGEPVLVLDAAAPLAREPAATVTRFGVSRSAALEFAGTGEERLVSTAPVPGLGATTRTALLRLDDGDCAVEVAISVDRGVFSTAAGWLGLASAMLFGASLVMAARRRAGGWRRRFLLAAPLGLLAGAGEAVLLHETGAFDPASRWSWWLPVAGLGLAAVLPLTRRRPPRPEASPPTPAQVGRWRPESLFARTGPFEVWRASRDDRPERALLKVARPERAGEPAVRLMRDREAEVLARLDHPHCVRLAEPPTADGHPALVLADVEGTTLRAVLADRGRLPGPQAIAVTLGLLAGVGKVHELGLVHRGVRPENVWLDQHGNTLLAGFELACPGIEHPVAAEGGPPYASPEQRAGAPLDGRSDLWSCAAVLVEQLTGQAPAQAAGPVAEPVAEPVTDRTEPPSSLDDLPAPLVGLVRSALAAAPESRPDTAAWFAAQLRQVAAEAYGRDWEERAAVGAALLVHGAIGSAVAGYAAAGGASSAGAGTAAAAGAGAGAAAGAGAGTVAGAAGLGAASAGPEVVAALGAAGTGSAGSASASTVAAPSGVAVAGDAGVSGGVAAGEAGASATAAAKAGAAVTPVAAAAVAIVAGAVAFVAPSPAEAATELVTPAAAHIIFVRTVDEARADDYRHLTNEATGPVEDLWADDEAYRQGELAEIVVGVPPEQYAYPAWFVASAELRSGDTVVYLFARFDRSSSDQPWLATAVIWSLHQVMAPPVLDQAGWLAPPPDDPEPTEPPDPSEPAPPPEDVVLVVDPQQVAQRYVDWFNRSAEATEVVDDDLLALQPGLDDDIVAMSGRSMLFTQAFFGTLGRSERDAVLDPEEPAVWLADSSTALVTFTVTIRVTNWASEEGTPCVTTSTTIIGQGRHRKIGFDFQQAVRAEVPVQQPWRGQLETEPVTVLINDDITMAQREVYVPERSIPC